MSGRTNHRVKPGVRDRPGVPGWAEEDWENTITRFLTSVDDLPEDVERAYRMVSGPPERGMLRSLGDVWDATGPVLFNSERLAQLLMDINPRVLELWKQGTITLEQVQFYVLRLFREAAARVRGSTDDWLPSIPE